MLKLKTSENKGKRVSSLIKVHEKQNFTVNFSKCRLPVEGKSIVLQSPKSFIIKERVLPLDLKENTKVIQGYRPELYETLIKQYKSRSKNRQSGQYTPENLSPRIYKLKRKSPTPKYYLNTEIQIPLKLHKLKTKKLDKCLSSKQKIIANCGKRAQSSKSFKKLKQRRLNL